MAAGPLNAVLRHIRTLAAAGQFTEQSDGQLLQRFVDARDEIAFEALMRRHGPWVLGVCRRFLGNGPDLDDVFQATFLVLARKAGSIRRRTSVASWLYGVAYRLARDQLAQVARRRRHERGASGLEAMAGTKLMHTDPAERASMRELGAILDEEMQRLSKHHREAMVLCHLEGLSVAEAAKRLGCPLPTLKSRLERARDLIRKRLVRRGVVVSGTGLAVVFADQTARAAVPAKLLYAALDAAIAFSIKPVAGAAVSAQAAALAKGVLKTTILVKLSVALFAAMTTAVVGVGAALVPGQALRPAHVPDKPTRPMAVAVQPRPAPRDLYGDFLPAGAIARLGTTRWHHAALVRFAAFLPDGKTVLSVSHDEIIHIWEFPSGKELRVFGPGTEVDLQPKSPWCWDAALSPDGKTLAASFVSHGVRLWDVPSGKELPPLNGTKRPEGLGLAFAPDGRHLATMDGDGNIHIWDWAADKQMRSFNTQLKRSTGGPRTLAFAPDGKTLLSVTHVRSQGMALPTIELWDPSTGQQKATLAAKTYDQGLPPAFSPDSKLLAYGAFEGKGGSVVMVDVATGRELHRMPDNYGPLNVVFSWDSASLLGRCFIDWTVREWDVSTGKQLRQLGAPQKHHSRFGNTTNLALSPDGKSLLAVDYDHALRVIHLNTGKTNDSLEYTLPLRMVSFTRDGKQVATQSEGAGLHQWDSASGKQVGHIATPTGAYIDLVTASPDGRYLALLHSWSAQDPHPWTLVIETATGKEIGKVPGKDLAFSQDGKTLAVGEWHREAICLYDLPAVTSRCSLPIKTTIPKNQMEPDGAHLLFFSPDGQLFAAFQDAGVIGVWETANGKLVGKVPVDRAPIFNGAFTPDGRAIAVEDGDGTTALWEIASGQRRRTFGPQWAAAVENVRFPRSGDPYGRRKGAPTIAFSPDGKLLAHAGMDKTVHLWDVATSKTVANFSGHTGTLLCVAFSPDGTRLASGSADTTALIWDVAAVKRPAASASGKFTDAQALAHWVQLAGPDANKAFDAILALAADPTHSLPFLQQQLKPPAPASSEQVKLLIAQLDDEQYKVREKAAPELRQLGEQVLPALEKTLATKPTLELRRRVEVIRDYLTSLTLTGDRLRFVRAVEVLERIGSAEAHTMLTLLADGPPGTLETRTAQAALRRWRN